MSTNSKRAGHPRYRYDERPLSETMLEYAGWLFISVALIGAITLVESFLPITKWQFDWSAWWFVEMGTSFMKADAAWLLPTLLAIVLALYAALLGQKITREEAEDIYHTRRRLVPAGVAVAGLVTVLGSSAVSAVALGPADWTALPGVMAVSFAVVLFGLGIGRYQTRGPKKALKLAKQARRATRLRIARLDASAPDLAPSFDALANPSSGRHMARVLIITTTTIVIATTAIESIGFLFDGAAFERSIGFVPVLLLLNLCVACLGAATPLVLLSQSYDEELIVRVITRFTAGFFPIFFLVPSVLFSDQLLLRGDWRLLLFVIPAVVSIGFVELSLFARWKRLHYPHGDWTFRYAAFNSHRSSLVRSVSALDARIARFKKILRAGPKV
jgi:hypothetical protein